jgi:hypothetical protein
MGLIKQMKNFLFQVHLFNVGILKNDKIKGNKSNVCKRINAGCSFTSTGHINIIHIYIWNFCDDLIFINIPNHNKEKNQKYFIDI